MVMGIYLLYKGDFMSTKHKLPFMLLPLFVLSTASCDLFDNYEKPKKNEPKYSSIQLYNEDGTKFTGNGKIYLYYTGSDGNTVDIFYGDVTNGEYARRLISYDNKWGHPVTTYIDGDYVDKHREFVYSVRDNEPVFTYKPSSYGNVDISILEDTVDCTNQKSTFWGYKFYDKDDPDEYKLLETMMEKRDGNDYVTERLFYTDFVSKGMPIGVRYLLGELKYTKVLNDPLNNKKEKADVSITYVMEIGENNGDADDISVNFLQTYTHATYAVISETPDYIHYKVDITVGERGDGNIDLGDWAGYSSRLTLIDKNFRMRH